jgi:hypothetical protein
MDGVRVHLLPPLLLAGGAGRPPVIADGGLSDSASLSLHSEAAKKGRGQ